MVGGHVSNVRLSTSLVHQSRRAAAGGTADKRGRILHAVRETPGISKTELARRLRISQSATSALVAELIEAGIVEVDGVGDSTGGRPPKKLALNRKSPLTLAIDLAETNVRLGIVNLRGELVASARTPFQHSNGSIRLEPILDKARALAERYPEVAAAGIAVPGIVDRSRGSIREAANLGWRNLDLRKQAERSLGLPVEVGRNTTASLLGEEWWGVGTAADPLLFVTVGSGIGLGIHIGGSWVEGATGVAGEFGHILVDPNGKPCGCGKRGCLETLASSRALIDLYTEFQPSPPSGDLTVAGIAAEAKSGDPHAHAAITQTAHHLGLGLVTLVNLFNPATIVVGGELMDAQPFILPVVQSVIDQYAFDISQETLHIQPSTFHGQASLIGAAALAFDTLFQYIAQGT